MTSWLPSALVNHLWQSTLFVGVIWLAAIALRRNSARVRYWLWVAASVKFLVPFSALVSVGARFEWRAAPASAQPAVSFVMDTVFTPAVITAAAPLSSSPSVSIVPWVLLAVWTAGVLAVLASWWRQWIPVRAALREGTSLELGAQYHTRGLAVWSSPSMFEPAVIGIRRPVLLLPDGLIDRLTPAQVNALIAHERSHVGCHDNLAAAVHMAVEATFWFHPVVWWIESRMIDERERACDEAVLQSGSRPRDYAEGILEVCRRSVASPLACVAGVGGSSLRRRVESIMRKEIGHPLTAARRCALASAVVAAVGAPVAGGMLRAQEPAVVRLAPAGEAMAFDVASVRSNTSGDRRKSAVTRGRTYTATNEQLRYIIGSAYGVGGPQNKRLLGGPAWIGNDRFDIIATLPEGATARQVPAMLRALLADRFKLVVHTEMRETPIYALVPARSDGRLGPRLRKAAVDCEVAEAAREAIPAPKPGERGVCDAEVGGMVLGRGQRLTWLARMLAQFVGRPVVDRTGLTGGFDFDLSFPQANAGPGGANPAGDAGGGIFTALQEQLGLELEAIPGQVEYVVIDSVERPTEN